MYVIGNTFPPQKGGKIKKKPNYGSTQLLMVNNYVFL